MQSAILMHNTMEYKRSHEREFKQAIRNAVEFAEQHAPQLMVRVYVDDEQALAHSFQLYSDSAAILRHWQISDPHIAEVMKYCVVRRMEDYGNPADEVRAGILAALDENTVTFVPHFVGFHRLR